MRQTANNPPLTVRAIAGSHVILLGIDMEREMTAGVLGFAIHRTDHGNNDRQDWLEGLKTFKGANIPRGILVPTNQHPIQSFLWSDFTVRPKRAYTYRIVAMRGKPGELQEAEDVSVQIQTVDPDAGTHAVFFNRGVAGSQAYTKKFDNLRPDAYGQPAFDWLSRGLVEAMTNFIQKAQGQGWGLHASVYEFNYLPVVKEFKDAIGRGVDVKIVFDCKHEGKYIVNKKTGSKSPDGPWKENREALKAAGITAKYLKARKSNPSYISHNKFIVLLKDGAPQEVWTGSTNITLGGIFGHSNTGHLVRDAQTATAYNDFWKQLWKDPEAKQLRPWDEQNTPVPQNLPLPNSITPIFSPRGNLQALNWYAQRMDAAGTAIFMTAAFGVNDLFEGVFQKSRKVLRYLLLDTRDDNMDLLLKPRFNRIAVGDVLGENAFDRWASEHLTGYNVHVKYVHTKYALIDPLSEDPIVITGSANFSDASTKSNDENMLVIRGDKNVADIYLTEFNRLFQHFYFRDMVNLHGHLGSDPQGGYLKDDDSWVRDYFDPQSWKCKERLYFTGQKPFGP